MCFKNIILGIIFIILPVNAYASSWIEGSKATLQGLDKITARIKTFEVFVGESYKFGVLDIFVKRCVFSKPIDKPESLAFIIINDNSDRLSEVKFNGWMFASSPALSALEDSVYDISILSCTNDDKHSKETSSLNSNE